MKPLAYLMLLAVPALNAQQTPGSAAAGGVNFYSMEQEAALGAQLADEFQRQNKMLDSPRVNGYLESAGGRLLKQIPDAGFPFRFAAFADSEESGMHEPRVLPGAYIYVPEGLILAARDEAEFAGMLAHAVAQAANRDATRQASRAQLTQIATIPLIVSGGPASDALRQNAGNTFPVAFLQFQRGSELEADYRAVAMMASAGWDPEGLVRYIGREQPSADARMPGSTPRVFSSVPPLEERMAALRKRIDSLPPREYSRSAEFAAVQAEVRRLKADRTPGTPAPMATPRQK